MDTFQELIKKEQQETSRRLQTLAIVHKVLKDTGLVEVLPYIANCHFWRRTGYTKHTTGHPDWPKIVYNDLPEVNINLYIEDEHRDKVRDVFFKYGHETRKSYSVSENSCGRPGRQLLLFEEWRLEHNGSKIYIKLYRPTHLGERIAGCEIKEVWSKPYTPAPSYSPRIVCDLKD